MDGLGSVRQITDAAGGVVGEMRYSPFGEIEAMSGLPAMFGYTGEQQGGTNNLVYLRARYYNPALGRFLTPDSVIPDVTNGQSLNAYAYVYNDPVNLVDPSGNIPIPPLPGIDRNDLRNSVRRFAEKGLDVIDYLYSEPEGCSCDGQPWNAWFWPPIGGTVTQAAWGYASQPAGAYGSFVIEAQLERTITVSSWWRKLPGMQSRIVNRIIPQNWGYGYKTVIGPWEPLMSEAGWIDEIVPSGFNRTSGTYPLGESLRYRVASEVKLKNGLRGAAGATLIAGLIDGLVQALSDIGKCFSKAEQIYRIAIATGLGLLAGGLGAAFFVAAAGVSTLAAIPILTGLAVGLSVSAYLQKEGGIKDSLFAIFPN